jgi:predicted RNA-binding Zn-ribbon protein involved in translation (DUF1610 family)
MGNAEVVCPHCGKQKIKVETENKFDGFKKVKGGNSWRPLVSQLAGDNWIEDPHKGVAVECKCGKHFVLRNFTMDATSIQIDTAIPDTQAIAVYCKTCKQAFVSHDFKCPSCGGQY